jgi:putative membrane protein
MLQTITLSVMMATAAAFIPASGVQSARDPKPTTREFLEKAAEGQQLEIAFGQLAAERAAAEEVKEFGVQMMDDHRKTSAEIRQLASKEGVTLPVELTGKHRDKKDEFARLSGSDFDRAYMRYMLRDHRKDLKAFERSAKAINNPQVQEWAKGTLPLLRQHLRKAQQVAASIGMNSNTGR